MTYSQLERVARRAQGGSRWRGKWYEVVSGSVTGAVADWKGKTSFPCIFYFSCCGAVATVLALVYTVVQALFNARFWPYAWNILAFGTVPLFAVCWLALWVPALRRSWERFTKKKEPWEIDRDVQSGSSQRRPCELVSSYLTGRIDELAEELVGQESRYRRARERVQGLNAKARRLREQFDARLRVFNAEYLRRGRERAEAVVEQTDGTLERLAAFRAKVDAFISECRGAVAGLEPALRDLELVREVDELAGLASELECEVRDLIAEAVTKLQARMVGVRIDVEARFRTRGIPLSDLLAVDPDPKREHDAFRALAELDHRIERFDPKRLLDSA